jgi:glycosyltransferase involved in cell wall biosynthesis
MAIRVHLIRTEDPHWHRHSGLNPFQEHLDSAKLRVEVHLLPRTDEGFFTRTLLVRGLLRTWVQRRDMPWYKFRDLTAEVRAFARCWRREIDVLHYLEGEHSAQYLPLALARLPKIRPPMIATFHQPPHLLPQLLRRDVIAKLDYVTVVSPEQLPFFQNILSRERVRFIPLGVDTEYFQAGMDPVDTGSFRCITVGQWLRDYNTLQEAITLLRSSRDIEFHIVSPHVDGLDALPNVTVHWNLSDDALRQLYHESHVLVLPLLDSTANCTTLEALACGLPVIATDLPSVRTYLPGREAILVEKNEPHAIVEAIQRLVGNPELRRTMAREARRRAEELAWSRIAARYGELYLEAVAAATGQVRT